MGIDRLNKGPDLLTVPSVVNRFLRGEVCAFHEMFGIEAAEADPDIFPRLRRIGAVMDRSVRVNQEGVPLAEGEAFILVNVNAFPADDVMEQEVVTHTWAPAIARGTLLTARILDIE